MAPAMEAAPSTADSGRYHLFSSCHALPTLPVAVVIKHDAHALLSADTFQQIAEKCVASSSSMSLASVAAALKISPFSSWIQCAHVGLHHEHWIQCIL